MQKLFQNLSHVGVGGVNFVDHEKAAGQSATPQMRVFHLKAGEHRLVHRADGDGRGQEPRRMLGGPSLRGRFRVVVPFHAPMGQALAFELPRAQHTRDRQHGLRRLRAEHPA